mmetsp:Transcript_25633/g.49070  ORF Transcript_25633/g.49070 Transcript_25633/m.49070 type:complete len:90 (-) Transcript_25633:147-416(-)
MATPAQAMSWSTSNSTVGKAAVRPWLPLLQWLKRLHIQHSEGVPTGLSLAKVNSHQRDAMAAIVGATCVQQHAVQRHVDNPQHAVQLHA